MLKSFWQKVFTDFSTKLLTIFCDFSTKNVKLLTALKINKLQKWFGTVFVCSKVFLTLKYKNMNTIRIKKKGNNLSEAHNIYDTYCVELIKNQKVSVIYYVEKPEFVFDIILQNIKDFKAVELRCFLNEFTRRNRKINHRRSRSLYVKSNYKSGKPYTFNAVVDYHFLKIAIVDTLNRLNAKDRVSIKF